MDILEEVKTGLGISGNQHDMLLLSKISAVKNYMENAGVSATQLASPLSAATILVGVTDLWDLKSGEIKFSPIFNTLVSQLAVKSL